MAAIVPMLSLWPAAATFPAEGWRLLYPGSLALFGFIGFTVLRIPGGWSNPLYLAPLFVSVVLIYGMFWFVWAYFGALIAFACLAGPFVLAEITGSMLPIRVRSILVFVAFAGSLVCANTAVNLGEFFLMAYYTKVLQPDETVKVVGKLHWWIYGRGLITLAIAAALLVFSDRLPDPDWQYYARMAGGVAGALGVLLLLAAWIKRTATEIVVTDRRVIYKRGVIARHTVEMNVSKIETVDVEQGLSGRIWNYGTLLIRGTGAGFEPLIGVGAPLRIRNAIVAG